VAEQFFREQYRRAAQAQSYAARRGLSTETVEQFRLGFAPAGRDRLALFLRGQRVLPADAQRAGLVLSVEDGVKDRFWNRLIFPILDLEGRPIAFGGRAMEEVQPKYLNSPETPIFTKGRSLYGLHLARRGIEAAGYAVVVEGYMDVIACHQAGFSQTVATLGTAITPEAIRLLRRYTSQLVLAYDGDSAGLGAALRSAPAFEEAGCEVRIARLPAGGDPDTVIKESGAVTFQRLLDDAEPLIDYHLGEIARKHDLSTARGRLALVQEAAGIVRQLRSTVAREHHRGQFEQRLRRLAEQWHPGDAARAVEAERALRVELQRAWEMDRQPATPARPDEFDGAASDPAAAPVRILSGEGKAEALLLRAALTEERWWAKIGAALGAEAFLDPCHQCVASVLFGHTEEWNRRLQVVWADAKLTEIASGLLVPDAGPPLSDDLVAGALNRLTVRRKQQRKKELERGVLDGAITREDARYQEYLRLVRELTSRPAEHAKMGSEDPPGPHHEEA